MTESNYTALLYNTNYYWLNRHHRNSQRSSSVYLAPCTKPNTYLGYLEFNSRLNFSECRKEIAELLGDRWDAQPPSKGSYSSSEFFQSHFFFNPAQLAHKRPT